ncbi:MAG: tRNA (adenosine(37)-N6)-threonylcarbamoyltransferase complex transferase subunit TsaD [Gammaproteobacteria bacterium]
MALVLGIESSCDDTAAALYDSEKGLLGQQISSSTALHLPYGGVVPELASRDHIQKLSCLVGLLFKSAQLSANDLSGIAYTQGPGLAGSLMVGAMFGQSLAYGFNLPFVGVHHIEGHLLAVMLEEKRPDFPFLGLIVSGGHTLLVHARAFGDYVILGQSLDDAAGEAFDKVGKLMGLPYPGGPVVAKLAEQGDPKRFRFPRPLTQKPGLDFSFSGLKTEVNTTIKQLSPLDDQTKADIACAFEAAVIDTLIIKCQRALKETGLDRLVIAGGVGANKRLRQHLSALAAETKFEVYFPRPQLCTDNAAMIAYCGHERLKRGLHSRLGISIRPRWVLSAL